MNWRQRIMVDWPNDPQRSHRAKEALRQIEEGLSALASLGHPLHIDEGYQPPPKPEWPKVVFHIREGSRLVNNEDHFNELGPGWYDTMDAAREAAGHNKQKERGGMFGIKLPSIFRRSQDDISATKEMDRMAREIHRKYVAEQRALFRERAIGSEAKRNARALD